MYKTNAHTCYLHNYPANINPHLNIKYVLEKYQILLNVGFQILDSTLKYSDLNKPHVNVPIVEHDW